MSATPRALETLKVPNSDSTGGSSTGSSETFRPWRLKRTFEPGFKPRALRISTGMVT